MAHFRNWFPIRTAGVGRVTIYGAFTTDGSGDVAALASAQTGFTATRSDTGIYTITMQQPCNAIIAVVATLLTANAQDSAVQIVSKTASTGVVVLRTLTAGAAANFANGGIDFAITIKDSSAPR